MENPIKMNDLGVPLFSETPIWENIFLVHFFHAHPSKFREEDSTTYAGKIVIFHQPGLKRRGPISFLNAFRGPGSVRDVAIIWPENMLETSHLVVLKIHTTCILLTIASQGVNDTKSFFLVPRKLTLQWKKPTVWRYISYWTWLFFPCDVDFPRVKILHLMFWGSTSLIEKGPGSREVERIFFSRWDWESDRLDGWCFHPFFEQISARNKQKTVI